MESADAKIIRAHENIEGITREMNEWFASIKVNIILKTSPESPLPWLVVYAEDYIPPIRLSMSSASASITCGRQSITSFAGWRSP
jgi:hypothetical protein